MMECEFGERFVKLFRGPMWSGFTMEDDEMKDPMKARVNVASVAHRTLTQDLEKSEYNTKPVIQKAALKKLKEASPDGNFWIKIDGTDIKPALQESKRQEWNGDVDMLDGSLKDLKDKYKKRRKQASSKRVDKAAHLANLEDDNTFLLKYLNTVSKEYAQKIKSPTTSQEKLKDLAWTIVETSNLLKTSKKLEADYLNAQNKRDLKVVHKGHENEYMEYLRFLFAKKRHVATHVLVVMLSDELRNKKPYALPVQYLPYHSLKDEDVRDITDELKKEMKKCNLNCVGTVTDGEFATLRAKGTKRPVHIAQVISNVRKQVNQMRQKTLLQMLTKTGENADGTPMVNKESAVPAAIIDQIARLVEGGNTMRSALEIVRSQLVPPNDEGVHEYQMSTWRPHCREDLTELMKTIVATYTYRQRLNEYVASGVDFRNYLYVPEVDEITGKVHHHREDHNHLHKRITKHTRDGRNEKLVLSRFSEAMKDGRMSYYALIGKRKQSVKDSEEFLSHSVASFFREKNYFTEAEFVQVFADWHEATDGRGMSQEERKAANERLRDYILHEWTPWWSEDCDLSHVDINRPLDTVCGLSRETFIGVTGNIDSQELRRTEGKQPEHPRSSTTDDVECFFSLSHRKQHGQHPTHKKWKYSWQRLIWEFSNRLDPDLPFWYWTLNERFSLGEQLRSFD
ncbi:uncharacterized protein [Amphiura filiformis]|uniref:uncharacterized protein n=1 Tax=Amphiura filiformis TaxID=82378 RepID=UPI003B213ECC